MSEHHPDEPETAAGEGEQWRSLASRGGCDPFEEFVRREYPSQLRKFMDPPERREFLKLMGASFALAGIGSSCTRQPKETILPYARNPESTIPGKPVYFATSMPWPTGAIGILVESHEGRPTKIEGNPDHPASLGATDAITQASILGLYDPDRSQAIKYRGRIRAWGDFLTSLKQAMTAQAQKKGAGLRILTGIVNSPTMAAQIGELLEQYPRAKYCSWDPIHSHLGGPAFDFPVLPAFDRAEVVVSIGSDFLGAEPGSVRATRDFVALRKARGRSEEASRLYVAESAVTLTGAMADHRIAVRPSELEAVAKRLSDRLGEGSSRHPIVPQSEAGEWIEAVLKDLEAHRGRSIVVAGRHLSEGTKADVAGVNTGLWNRNKTVTYCAFEPVADPLRQQHLQALSEDMRHGEVEVLLILGGNPVYDTPTDLGFGEALRRVPFRTHLSIEENETSDLCDWHLNEAHYLESWGDAWSADRTVGLIQPLIAPLYGGKTTTEVLAAFAGRADLTSHEIVREHWRKKHSGADFEAWWRRALHDGIATIAGELPTLDGYSIPFPEAPAGPGGLEILFLPDPTIWDGRFANNGWLQELPKPVTKLTWDNAALVSPKTAHQLQVENEDVVELELDGRKVRAPIWIVPGQADYTVVVHLGYGRTKAGRVGTGAGFNAYALRTTKAMWSASGLKVTKTGEKQKLSCTQEHDRMEGRDPVRVATLERFRANPNLFAREKKEREEDTSLYPPHPKGDYSWGMVIDLGSCTGCGACVAACQAENNSPIVGREEVRRGREMHWLRVDRYFEGDPAKPALHHQPVPCMHCENAPCEVVCPVGATTHSDEGLNQMVYNRCVGTRYCGDNCPFKVRRFNFFLYQDFETEVTKLQRNPDVSVRSRGVMEKCTYCVQRIQEARIHAEKEGRKIRDGEVRTACQQVCPAQAISFGDIADPSTDVAKRKSEPREYGLLESLNIRPRTTYLAKIVNPNPELGDGKGTESR
jgi:Fe-S-cluster-containing dehydrogenase component